MPPDLTQFDPTALGGWGPWWAVVASLLGAVGILHRALQELWRLLFTTQREHAAELLAAVESMRAAREALEAAVAEVRTLRAQAGAGHGSR